jgi:hypothetical protein
MNHCYVVVHYIYSHCSLPLLVPRCSLPLLAPSVVDLPVGTLMHQSNECKHVYAHIHAQSYTHQHVDQYE